jgi:hypothetical protein
MADFLTVEDSLQLAAGSFNFCHSVFDIVERKLHCVSDLGLRASDFRFIWVGLKGGKGKRDSVAWRQAY